MSDVKIVYIKSVPHIYIDGHEIHGVFRFEIGQSSILEGRTTVNNLHSPAKKTQ